MEPRFLDFEASSLSLNSYPIEMAWSDEHGRIESHLIDPSPVRCWTDWSEESQVIHGITRDDLLADGKNPAWLCDRVSAQLRGQTLNSDAAAFDEAWLRELFRGAGRDVPDVRVASVMELACIRVLDDVTVARFQKEARNRAGGQHRAGMDVRYLLELYRLARDTRV